MTASDWVQAIALVVLVAVTIFYAYQAKKASESAEASAQASKKMAEGMREQTETLRETVSMSIRPSVSIEVVKIGGGDNYPFEPPTELQFELQNAGKGPARNLVVTCEAQDRKVEYSKIELPSLNIGDKRRLSIHRTTAISHDRVRVAYLLLKAVYNDELEKTSYIKLQIDRDEGEWKPGEITSGSPFGGEHD